MIILGIDPGYGKVGWAVISFEKNKASYLDCDCFETKPNSDFYERIKLVYDTVIDLIKKHKPDCLAIESVFFNTNAKTAILTSQARGAIAMAGLNHNLKIFDYTPLQVKNTLIGYGRADKKQIQTILSFHLNLKNKIEQDDAADALAIALTHAYTNYRLI